MISDVMTSSPRRVAEGSRLSHTVCRVVTIFFTGLLAALLFTLGTNIPSQRDQQQLINYQNTLLANSNITLLALNASNNALATPSTALAQNISHLAATSSALVNTEEWLSSYDVTRLFSNVNYLNGNNTVFQPLGM